jgi:predicted dehydrogenase
MNRPRLGFVGLGWIGRHRLAAVRDSGVAEIVVVADPDETCRRAAAEIVPAAASVRTLSDALVYGLDGVVIATPSAMHASQTLDALAAGAAVFCQKPLARTAEETRAVIRAAARLGRPLGVDLSYRSTRAMRAIAHVVESGAIGDLFAASLTFHNAYGPDRDWFYDPIQSGGGCLIDLGSHLVDLALWLMPGPVSSVDSRLFQHGRRLVLPPDVTEDYAVVRCDFENGATAVMQCSWKLPAGQDCVMACEWFGTKGGVRLANVDGSLYDFIAERLDGTSRSRLVDPPDQWGGRAIVGWVEDLARGRDFDAADAARFERAAEVLDAAYGRGDWRGIAEHAAQERTDHVQEGRGWRS